ncbi:MAG TPA: hypothetical protein VJW76_04685, partial [Verrucomicrobiae bacterium]|nr:hypothetical protein [Verrucomicrobiae bacterium]
MKAPSTALIFLVGWLSTDYHASGQELPMFGQLPIPGKNWKLREQGKSDDFPVPWEVPWAWVVMTNSESGDVLSFAAHKLPQGSKLELIYLSDTAREIFPAGDPLWVSTRNQDFNPYTIRNSVVRLNLLDSANNRDPSPNALEYTFVHEEKEGKNRM